MGRRQRDQMFGVSLIGFCVVVAVGQMPPKPAGPEYFLESWTGQPGKADQTEHKPVGKGSQMACIDVQPRDGGVQGCHLKFENGQHYDLAFRQAIQAPDTDVVYLTCTTKPSTGVKTTYCKLSVIPPKK